MYSLPIVILATEASDISTFSEEYTPEVTQVIPTCVEMVLQELKRMGNCHHFSWVSLEVSQVRSGSSNVPTLDSSQRISPLSSAAFASGVRL